MTLRPTLTIEYGDEKKEIIADFNFIERVRSNVKWEDLVKTFGDGDVNYVLMTNFIYYNLIEAGFNPENVNKQDIFDEMTGSAEAKIAYINLIVKILTLYQGKQEKGSKKKPKLKISKT